MCFLKFLGNHLFVYLDSSDSILCWGFVVERSDPVCFQRSCGRIRLGCHSPNHAHHWQFLAFPLKGRNNLVHGARKLFVFLDINCKSHWIQEHLYREVFRLQLPPFDSHHSSSTSTAWGAGDSANSLHWCFEDSRASLPHKEVLVCVCV